MSLIKKKVFPIQLLNVLAADEMIKHGIVPAFCNDDLRDDVSVQLAQDKTVSSKDARKLKRKFRKLYRKFIKPLESNMSIRSQYGDPGQSPTKIQKARRKILVYDLLLENRIKKLKVIT